MSSNFEMIADFRNKLANGPVIGPFSKTEDPAFVETMGQGGFDFVILDLEHGPNSIRSIQNLVRAAQLADLFPIVRLPENAFGMIGAALDIGAGGVQVPQIIDPAGAQLTIQHARFAPTGQRGVCRYVRAADYSAMDKADYFKAANSAVVVIQLEGREALDNLNAILEVPGYDIVFVGPYDLSQSLGVTGEVDHPRVVAEIEKIVKACAARNVAVGTFVESPAAARRWIDVGVHYICYAVDVGLFLNACRDTVREIKKGGAA